MMIKALHKNITGGKIFIFICIAFLLYIYVPKKSFDEYQIITSFRENNRINDMKYILVWEEPHITPFYYLPLGQVIFRNSNCLYKNCFVTTDTYLLGDIKLFDAIIFSGPELVHYKLDILPKKRSFHQKFVFGTVESNQNYPICDNRYDGFFNWTWTYRLDSDAYWGYIAVKNTTGHEIGPKETIQWIQFNDMDPISEELKIKLVTKTKAAAWIISDCQTRGRREVYFMDLEIEMNKLNMTLDIFGKCGIYFCERKNKKKCFEMLGRKYYFYFSFENSWDVDYVTEKILIPLQNNMVPVVFGGANYTRFMPDGIYLNAMVLSPNELANKMYKLIHNPEEYYTYFRWKKYYSFHARFETPDTNDYCNFCSMLNNDILMKKTTVHKHFREWWSPKDDVCQYTVPEVKYD